MSLPAILGGTPIRPQGPPGWPAADPEIRDVLVQAFRDGTWGKYHANHCQQLESWLREYHNVEHVHLCGSGNYAVELGLRALKIRPGDEVILADYDYPGNFLSIHAVGAIPVLVDVEPRSWQLSIDAVRQAIGPKTKAILASHLHGGRVAMPELLALANDHSLMILEDAAQTPGAWISGKRAGTWGHVGVLSFGGSKLLSAGRGGALLTSSAAAAQGACNFLTRAGNIVCPLSELQAALLLPQCQKLDERNHERWHNVQALVNALAAMPGVRPFVDANAEPLPAFYKLGLQFDGAEFGLSRMQWIAAIRAEGFALDQGYAAAHTMRSPKRYRQGSSLVEASRAEIGCVMLHHPILLEGSEEMRDFADAVRRIHEHAPAIQRSV